MADVCRNRHFITFTTTLILGNFLMLDWKKVPSKVLQNRTEKCPQNMLPQTKVPPKKVGRFLSRIFFSEREYQRVTFLGIRYLRCFEATAGTKYPTLSLCWRKSAAAMGEAFAPCLAQGPNATPQRVIPKWCTRQHQTIQQQ